MGGEAVPRGEPLPRTDLVDLSGVDLGRLNALPDSVFAAALRRVLLEFEEESECYVGFINDE